MSADAHGNIIFFLKERVQDPSSRAASIAEEYQRARLGAAEAKQKKDKKSQGHFGDIIQKLKREMSSLGVVLTSVTLSSHGAFCFRTSYMLLDLFFVQVYQMTCW